MQLVPRSKHVANSALRDATHTLCYRNVARHKSAGEVRLQKLRTAQWRYVGTFRTLRAEIYQSEEIKSTDRVRSLSKP